jgi:cytochrome P450
VTGIEASMPGANPLAFLLAATRRDVGVVRYLSGDGVGYLVTDPDVARWVLVEGADRFGKRTAMDERFKRVIGHGLFSREGHDWVIHRRLMAPWFAHDAIEEKRSLIDAAIDVLVDRWDAKPDGSVIDVTEEMGALSLDVTCRVLFGEALGARAIELARAPADALLLLTRPEQPALLEARRVVSDLVRGFIAGARSSSADGTLLRALLTWTDPTTGVGLDAEALEAEVTALLLAGFETTSGALAWTWYALAQHQEMGAGLASSSQAGHEAAADAARSVLLESMRLFPPAWIVSRNTLDEETLGGRVVPAGAQVAVSPYAMHRHPALWSDPDAFDTSRFAPGTASRRHPMAYIPFGAGRRRCIGEDLAMIEATTALSRVAPRYRLSLATGQVVNMDPQFTLRPRGGLPMTLSRA